MRIPVKQISGGGGGAVTSIEVDFGSVHTAYKFFTIPDVLVTVSSNIIAVQSGKAATGGSDDDAEMDPIVFSARAQSGQFVLSGRALDGPVVGKYTVNYTVG